MPTVDTVVIGAGHAGLAVSRLLAEADVDHVVLDRGQVGHRWRTERWDSLHLLTPAWMTQLPRFESIGPDPEAFVPAAAFVDHLERYAASFGAPVVTAAQVRQVSLAGRGYQVHSDAGTWYARRVVIATGPHARPRIPAGLDPEIAVPASGYRNPEALAPGGVLVVGASASGVQIADELARAGREVTLAVGQHTRMPRRYRGLDAFWWLEVTGRLARTIDTMPDRAAARREPSMQLIGRPGPSDDLDLRVLQELGVRLVGRLAHAAGRTVELGTGLEATANDADGRLHRLLDDLDDYARRQHLADELLPAHRPRPVRIGVAPGRIDLRAEGIGTVVVAAGYEPDYSWLRLPVLGRDGHVVQRRGVTPAPGLYVVGQRFQHRRDSGFIHGARHDARGVVDHLVGTLTGRPRPRAELREDVA